MIRGRDVYPNHTWKGIKAWVRKKEYCKITGFRPVKIGELYISTTGTYQNDLICSGKNLTIYSFVFRTEPWPENALRLIVEEIPL